MANFEKRIIEIIDHCQIYTSEIYFVGLTPVDDDKTCPVSWDKNLYYHFTEISRYDNEMKQIVEQDGRAKFIDIFDLLNVTDFEDGCHPNSVGHRKIFKKIISELKK